MNPVHLPRVADHRGADHRDAFLKRNEKLFGPSKVIPPGKTIAARLAKAGAAPPRSAVTTVGAAPEGFGKVVLWDQADSALALIIFLNASDSQGVMISGVRKTDTITFVHADGLASFAEDTENEGIGAIIGLVAVGAQATATAFGAPEAAPLIAAADKFAQEQFKEKQVKSKVRDPFGVTSDGGHARQEGGLLISMPAAGQNYISGDEDHQDRWIQKPGTRVSANYPDHIKNAFFLRTGKDSQTATTDGDITIYPWDHAFADNFGFYRLHVLMKRGNGQNPVVE